MARFLSLRVFLTCVVLASAAGAQERPLVRTEGWRHLFEPGPADPGMGVVSLVWPSHPTWSDTLALYQRPEDRQRAGYFLFESEQQGGWSFAVAWPESLTTNALEFGYEVVGLPVDSITPDGRWVRVVPGFTAAGVPVFAWAPVAAGATEIVRWADHLLEHDLFFRQGVTPAFLDTPDGRPVPFELPTESPDYILHPLEARDEWLRVRVVAPSDYCADPESPRQAEVWIRYLDRTGRPLVWYHTRGC